MDFIILNALRRIEKVCQLCVRENLNSLINKVLNNFIFMINIWLGTSSISYMYYELFITIYLLLLGTVVVFEYNLKKNSKS